MNIRWEWFIATVKADRSTVSILVGLYEMIRTVGNAGCGTIPRGARSKWAVSDESPWNADHVTNQSQIRTAAKLREYSEFIDTRRNAKEFMARGHLSFRTR